MHRLIIMSHNLVTKIEKYLTGHTIDTRIPFQIDMTSSIWIHLSLLPALHRPLPFLLLDSNSISCLAWKAIHIGTCLLLEQTLISLLLMNLALCWADDTLWVCFTVASWNLDGPHMTTTSLRCPLQHISNLTLQIIMDAWCAVMNQGMRHPQTWINTKICAFVAILFTLHNCGTQCPWHHMYHLSSTSSPSITTWDQLNGEILACNREHRKVKWIYTVRSFSIDHFDSWWNSIGYSEGTSKVWNYNRKFSKEIYIWHFSFIYIY